MSADEGKEEYEEVQADLRKRDEEYLKANSVASKDLETGIVMGSKRRCFLFSVFSKVLLEAFTLTFIAEWGDRSQITTIILAAREVSILIRITEESHCELEMNIFHLICVSLYT